MALTQEQLLKLGVPETACAGVIAASSADTKASIDGHYVPKEKMDSILEKNKALEGQVTDRDAQIVKLGALSGDAEKFKAEAEKNAADNAEQKKQFEKEMSDKDKKLAVQLALIADGCVDPAEVAGKFNLEQVILDKEGKLVGGYDNQRDSIKEAKAYYFSDTAKPAEGDKKPADKSGLPPGWVPVGQTPPAGADLEELTGPEAEAVRMVEQMNATNKGSADVSARAQSHYFGTAPASVPGNK